MRIRVTIDVFRHAAAPDPEPAPDDRPSIYDVSSAHIERAPGWDHDTRPPIGFTTEGP